MRKVAFLKSHLGGLEGGLEKQTRELLKAFANKGFEVTLLTAGKAPEGPFEIIPILIPKKISVNKVQAFDKWCQKYLKEHSFDVIFGLDRNSFQTHLRAGNGVHAAFLERRKRRENWLKRVSFIINPLHLRLLSIEKQAFEHPQLKAVIVNSEMVKREILKHYQVNPDIIHVIHNGVEWEAMKSHFEVWQEKKEEYFSQLHLSKDTFHFLFVGHDFKRKGLKPLIQALALLPNENFLLTVIGEDRKYKKAFEKLVLKLGLADKVRFLGADKNIFYHYQAADCLVIPTLYDPFANVTLEAMAMGLFIVTTPSNGACEILHPFSGIVTDNPFEYENFAKALLVAMHHPKNALSAYLIRQSVEHLDFSKQLPRIIELCLPLCQK